MYNSDNKAHRRYRLSCQECYIALQELPASTLGHSGPGEIPVTHPQLSEGCQMLPHSHRRHQQSLPQ